MGCNCGKRKIQTTKPIIKTGSQSPTNNNSSNTRIKRVIRRASR